MKYGKGFSFSSVLWKWFRCFSFASLPPIYWQPPPPPLFNPRNSIVIFCQVDGNCVWSNWSISHVFLMNCQNFSLIFFICLNQRLWLKYFDGRKIQRISVNKNETEASEWKSKSTLDFIKVEMNSKNSGEGSKRKFPSRKPNKNREKIGNEFMTKQKVKYLKWIKIFIVGKLIENSSLELSLIFFQLLLFYDGRRVRCDGFSLLLKLSVDACDSFFFVYSRETGEQLRNCFSSLFHLFLNLHSATFQSSLCLEISMKFHRISFHVFHNPIMKIPIWICLKLNQFHLTWCYHHFD